MKSCTALAVLFVSAVSAATSATDASEVDAKRAISFTTTDLLRLVGTTDRVRALLFKGGRSSSSSSSRRLAEQGGEGGLRLLTGTEGGTDSCEDKLGECRANLGACQAETDNDGATNLYVQMAQTCKLKQKTDGKGELYYELSSKDMDDDTYPFTDRPFRAANTVPTKQFVKNFGATFSEETGGRPNAAVTFRHADADNFEGPLIAVFVEAAYRKDSGKYVYELTQSEEQEKVNALKDFFRKGDGKDDGVVEYEMCSLFIDANKKCDPANVDSCNNDFCVWKEYESDCEACQCYVSGYRQEKTPPYFCEKSARTGNKAKCVNKRPDGDICHVSWQCAGGLCKDSTCKKLGEIGDPCDFSENEKRMGYS